MQHFPSAILHAGVRIAAAQAIELLQHGRGVGTCGDNTVARHLACHLAASLQPQASEHGQLQLPNIASHPLSAACIPQQSGPRGPQRAGEGCQPAGLALPGKPRPQPAAQSCKCQPFGTEADDDTRLWNLGSSKQSGLDCLWPCCSSRQPVRMHIQRSGQHSAALLQLQTCLRQAASGCSSMCTSVCIGPVSEQQRPTSCQIARNASARMSAHCLHREARHEWRTAEQQGR